MDGLQLWRWRDLTAAQQHAVAALSISSEQLEFAGSTDAAISHAQQGEAADGREMMGMAIVWQDDVVGFFLLRRGAQAPTWVMAGQALISALRIDAGRQGQGLASAALQVLPAWLRTQWSEVGELVLAVDEGNVGGIRAYEKAGWQDVGVRIAGRVGWERRMRLSFNCSEINFIE